MAGVAYGHAGQAGQQFCAPHRLQSENMAAAAKGMVFEMRIDEGQQMTLTGSGRR